MLRLAFELERQFPRQVHCEFAIGKATRTDYDPKVEARQRVDIVVSDFEAFVEDETAEERYRTKRHELFVEVKWLLKGWWGQQFEMDAHKRVAGVEADLKKLERHLALGRCQVAAMVVFDDEGFFEHHGATIDWPAGVERLVVSPSELRTRGLLD